LGNHKQALADALLAAALAPADAEVHASVGWAHYKLSSWQAARDSFATAAQLAPENIGELPRCTGQGPQKASAARQPSRKPPSA
jgi:tetratricopeptide (TPR) repeat protein